MKGTVKIGTRGSQLALWQARFIEHSLATNFPDTEFEIVIIKTTGDLVLDTALSKIGDKGLFTSEIENALLAGDIDLAVHSLKDLPTTQPDGLVIGAVAKRELPNDVLIAKTATSIASLNPNAIVATGSLRRKSQLLHLRPDVEVVDMRGNVPTRIRKFLESDADAMILAYAGIHRLGLDEYIKQIIPVVEMIPAVGQGAVASETREGELTSAMAMINDPDTSVCVRAERAFLRSLEGGCQVPIGAYAVYIGGDVSLKGFVGSLDGSTLIREGMNGSRDEPEKLGMELAEKVLALGANDILNEARLRTLEAG